MSRCALCGTRAQYRDRETGQHVCLEHARLAVVAASQRDAGPLLSIREATPADHPRIEELALYFWDETVVDCFDRRYDVMACPAFLACDAGKIVGVASFAVEEAWNAAVLVMLHLLPDYQGRGGGRPLVQAVCNEARGRGLARVIVATTNDDLPALSLYQRCGFHITGIETGRVAQDHAREGRIAGDALTGFAGIPVRDEVRFEIKFPG
ncbi:MAG: GNAT family N-acetyltransferase [Anaerolineae bacterium]